MKHPDLTVGVFLYPDGSLMTDLSVLTSEARRRINDGTCRDEDVNQVLMSSNHGTFPSPC